MTSANATAATVVPTAASATAATLCLSGATAVSSAAPAISTRRLGSAQACGYSRVVRAGVGDADPPGAALRASGLPTLGEVRPPGDG